MKRRAPTIGASGSLQGISVWLPTMINRTNRQHLHEHQPAAKSIGRRGPR
jgi:hypothetical protein